ncbi:MAG TPA: type II secretion system major pseudopilin GspG [Gemmatimonadaceae bacterium]
MSSRTSARAWRVIGPSRRRFETRASARAAFTLIELLVVIAIIATLASIVAPQIFSNVGEARRNAAKSQLQILSLALDSYRLDNDAFPTTTQGLDALRMPPQQGDAVSNWRGPYLRQTIPLDPWGRPYVYVSPGISNPTSYDLYTLGKDGRIGGAGEDADLTSWNGPVSQ